MLTPIKNFAMNNVVNDIGSRKRFTPVGIIFATLGLLLFAYFVWKANPGEVWGNIKQLGLGFLLVLLVSSIRPIVRAFAWTRCFEGSERLPFRNAFAAYLVGDAAGTLMPFGIVVSEPTKAALVRDRVPLIASLSALAIENLFYSLSVMLFIFSGTIALMLSFSLNRPMQIIGFGALTIVVLLVSLAYLVIRSQWRFLSSLLTWLHKRGIQKRFIEKYCERVSALEDRVYGFYSRNKSRVVPILVLEACYHLSGVLEVYTVLSFITDRPSLLTAFVLESVNRVINVAFKFVPLRLGVDEAGSGWFSEVLKLGKASGVTLAIIRKARIMCWTAVGVAVLVRRGLTLREVAASGSQVMREIKSQTEPSSVSFSELR